MTNPINAGVEFPLDDAGRAKTLAALEAVRKAQTENAAQALKGAKTYDEVAKANAKLEAQYRNIAKAAKQVDASFRTQEEQLKDTEKAVKEQAKALAALQRQEEELANSNSLENKLKRLDESYGKVNQNVGQAGDIASNIQQFGGIGGQVGGQVASAAALPFDALEALPRLTTALKGLPDILQAVTQASGLGGLAGSLQSAIPALGATGAALITLTGVAAAVAVPMLILTKVMDEMAKNAEAAGKAEQARIDIVNTQIATENELQRLVNSGDIEGILASREEAWQGLTDNSEQITAASNSLDELREREKALFEARNAAVSSLDIAGLAKWNNELGIVQAQIAAQVTNFDTLSATQSQLLISTTEADEALANFSQEQITAAQNSEALAQTQQDLAQTAQEYEQTLRNQEQILNQISQLENQANTLRENYAEQNLDRITDESLSQSQALETQALEEQFANEDRLANQQAFQDSLVAIEKEGQAKIEGLRAELNSLPAERLKAIGDAESKGNADIDKARKEYMKDSLKTLEKFQETEKRTQQRGQIERLRLLQDLNDSLSDAQRDNNVIAFLEAQRNGEKELSRQAQDASLEAQQRAADFARENEERRAALDERIADIQANIDKEREQINAQYAEKEAALQQSIADEQAAIQQRTQAAIAANNQQAANEAKNAERAALREQLQAQQEEQRAQVVEARRLREHQEQLGRIEQQAAAQRAALASVMAQISAIQTKAAQQTAQANSLSGGSSGSSTYKIGSNSMTFGGNQVKAFAEGGDVTRPTVGLLAETPGFGDRVIPFRKSDGLPISPSGKSALGRQSTNVTYAPSFNVTVGDIASKAEVSEALREYAMAHGQAEISKLEKMLNPS